MIRPPQPVARHTGRRVTRSDRTALGVLVLVVLGLALAAALALAVRVLADPARAALLGGDVLVPALVLGAVVLAVAALADERTFRR